MIEIHGEGPVPSDVMIVGEAPGADEERLGRPFVGAAGTELDRMLSEAGLHRSTCFVTNVSRQRPPNNKMEAWFSRKPRADFVPMRDRFVHPAVAEGMAHLLRELELVKPNLIVALGNTAMWALTGKWGVTDWRGSELMVDWMGEPTKVIPTYHPAAILRQWAWRAAAIFDLKRAARHRHTRAFVAPNWHFELRPSFEGAMGTLQALLTGLDDGPAPLSFDLETRAGHIACAGIAWTENDAICIPLMCSESSEGYWTLEQEAAILWMLRMVLTHPNARVVGQNLLYDAQYCWRHWHFVPRVWQDSMISHHTAFCELPKNLQFQASIYCKQFVAWKDPKIRQGKVDA